MKKQLRAYLPAYLTSLALLHHDGCCCILLLLDLHENKCGNKERKIKKKKYQNKTKQWYYLPLFNTTTATHLSTIEERGALLARLH